MLGVLGVLLDVADYRMVWMVQLMMIAYPQYNETTIRIADFFIYFYISIIFGN